MTCPECEYHKNRAARWRAEAYKLIGHEIELPWVGLTDEEIDDLYLGAGKNDLRRAREIEQALKEKNHG